MIVERETVITGPFNSAKAAEEKNGENLLVIGDKGAANVYIGNWEKQRHHSESN